MKYISSFFVNSAVFSFALIGLYIFFPFLVHASESHGTISSTYYRAKVCRDVPCTDNIAGTINFRPTGVTPITIDDVDGVDGVAWGNDLGWINFDPTGPTGVDVDPNTGILSGYAWAQVGGWVNMSPTGYGVTIDSNGYFNGYGWVGGVNGGWIKFDCSSTGKTNHQCVRTDWRPVPVRDGLDDLDEEPTAPTNPGNGGGGSATNHDVCHNLYGLQEVIPPGYVLDQGGFCVLASVDYCPNIAGAQTTMPSGYTINTQGSCVLIAEVPSVPGTDMCPNLASTQLQIPQGYVRDSNNFCVPSSTDYCPNIEGQQSFIPSGMAINDLGQCIMRTLDIPNMPVTSDDSWLSGDGREVLALPFIPSSWWEPHDVRWIAQIFAPDRSEQQSTRPLVDMVSVAVVVAGSALAAILLILFVWLFRKNVRGIVLEGFSKEVISGATVEFASVSNLQTKHVKTDKHGRYTIHLKSDHNYRVRVYNKNQTALASDFVSINKVGKTDVDLNFNVDAVGNPTLMRIKS